MNAEFKKVAIETLAAYPEAQVVHFTSDGQVFLQSNLDAAVNHQKYLNRGLSELKEMVAIYRKELDAEKVQPTDTDLNEAPTIEWTKKDLEQWLRDKGAGEYAKGNKEDLMRAIQNILDVEAGQGKGDQADSEKVENNNPQ